MSIDPGWAYGLVVADEKVSQILKMIITKRSVESQTTASNESRRTQKHRRYPHCNQRIRSGRYIEQQAAMHRPVCLSSARRPRVQKSGKKPREGPRRTPCDIVVRLAASRRGKRRLHWTTPSTLHPRTHPESAQSQLLPSVNFVLLHGRKSVT